MGLREEISKRDPFDQPEAEAALNIIRTSDALLAGFQKLFRQHDLTSAQYNVLRILRGAGHPLPSLEVAQRLITRVPDITRLVDRLEKAGLVLRMRCPEDRRVVHLRITLEGLERLERLDVPVQELHRRQMSSLEASELQSLSRALERLRAGMESD